MDVKEGLKQMCLVSDQETGHTSFRSGPVNQEFEKHCNVKYAQRGNELMVKAQAIFVSSDYVQFNFQRLTEEITTKKCFPNQFTE